MKKAKKILSLMLILIMCFSVMPMTELKIKASAATITFDQLNADKVFLKQPKGSVTCTLYAAAMMMRRYSMLRGDSNWSKITASSIKEMAWSGGLKNSFSYSNSDLNIDKIEVANVWLPMDGGNAAAIKKELKQCPEGIVIHSSKIPHAVLITDYTDGVFYCADSANGTDSGRISLSKAYGVTINNADSYWKVTSPVVDGPVIGQQHSYTTKYETAHPHKYYEECSCGDKKYTGKENELETCVECLSKHEKSFIGKMKVTASTKAVKALPVSSSDTIRNVSKNDEISVVAYLYNKYGNLWYKTSSGNYIHCSYLEVIQNDSLPPSNYLNAKFKVVCSEKNVKNDPISSSDTIKKIYRNEIINIIGYMYNEYGNLWYVLEDGGYVPHHYFSVVSSNIRTPSNYINADLISRADKSLRLEPSGSSEISGSVNKNSTVNVHGYVYNRFGNLWYMTNKEEFIFFSYLEHDTENSLLPSNYKYHTFTASDSKVEKTEPYEVAENNRIVSKGETVTTVGYLTNLYGNKWYITNEDYYVYPSNLKCIHQYNSKTTKPASCTETGIKTFICSLCSVSYTEAISKKSHSIVTIPAVSATCTKTGLTEGKKCSTCGTVTVAQQTVAKKSHSYSSSITTQPTCTKEGVKTYKCSCGANYTEKIAKKAHSIVTDNAIAATCTKTGLTEGKHCSVCGTVTVSQKSVDKTSHYDNNFDGKCDGCGISSATSSTPEAPVKSCSCKCHKGDFFFSIILFFQKLFGMNKVCACGVKH